MTDHQDQLDILIERAIDGRLLDSEGPELRAAVRALRDRAEQAAADRERYRDAWYSARIRAQANTPPPDGPCRVAEVDGTPVRVAGAAAFTPEGRAAFAEVVRAAQRRYAAEHTDFDGLQYDGRGIAWAAPERGTEAHPGSPSPAH